MATTIEVHFIKIIVKLRRISPNEEVFRREKNVKEIEKSNHDKPTNRMNFD